MIAEISLAIFPAALPGAAASRRAFVRVNFKANLSRVSENQDLARLVAPRMADERIFAGRGGRGNTTSPIV